MSDFSTQVYSAVAKIPRGTVATYGQVAAALGHPQAARAVGAALSKNTDPQSVPCHRVVKSDGSIGGYAFGGTDKKRDILREEGVSLAGGAVLLADSQVATATLTAAVPTELLYTEQMEWEGTTYEIEIYRGVDFATVSPVSQVQAVCFSGQDVVIYQDTKGNYGLPGGTVEEGESYEVALRRELLEEAAVELTNFGPLVALRTYEVSTPEEVSWQLRYWAEVALLDQPVADPDGKAVAREVVSPQVATEKIGWGRKLEIFISEAIKERQKHYD